MSEVEMLFVLKNGVAVGVSDGIYYMNAGKCWEEIPANTEKEAIKFCEEYR